MHVTGIASPPLPKDFVEVLCSLATYDNLLLLSTYFLFTLPTLSSVYQTNIFPYTVPYLYPLTNTFMTCSIYMTVGVAVNRYLDIISANSCRLKSGYCQALIVLLFAAIVNVPRFTVAHIITLSHLFVDYLYLCATGQFKECLFRNGAYRMTLTVERK